MSFETQGYRLKLTSDTGVTHPSGVSAWAGTDGFGNTATQATVGNRPAFSAAAINGLNTIVFNGGTQSLTLNTNTVTNNIFAGGGTVAWVGVINSAGGGAAGHIAEKLASDSTAVWNIINTTGGGGFLPIRFDIATTGTGGAFATNSVLAQSIPQMFTITYNSSTPTIPPVIRVIGVAVTVNTITPPTGDVLDDSGGVCNLGNRTALDRGMDGSFGMMYMWKRVLTDYELSNLELFLANKWGITLFDNITQWYSGRTFDVSYPDAPASVPLLICLHGGGGTGPSFEFQLQLGALFGQKAVYFFPTATLNNAVPGAPTWNSNFPPPTFNSAPDSTYLANLTLYVKRLAEARGFTISKVIVVGHSNGGMMGYRLIIDHPEIFNGLFAISADVMVPNPGSYTGQIQQWHGQDDANVPLAGGVGIGGNDYPPVIPTVQKFVYANSSRGVVQGTQSPLVIRDFNVIPSPAAHIISSMTNVLVNPPYSTTFAQLIYNFVFPS